jgi:2-polyprenyl-3-methyl-5-hydroxy-6-metoxy-1,4-benzoquinol methylase
VTNPYSLSSSKYSKHTILKDLIGQNKKVLDVGCNEGYLATYCDPSNKFFGIDNDKLSIEKARKVMKAEVYDLNSFNPLPSTIGNNFDFIVFADVLEHVNSPERVLKFFQKYLKKNGQIVVSLPNIANWKIRLGLLFGKFDYTDSGILDRTHLKLYTYKSGRELMHRSGLKIVSEAASSRFFGIFAKYLPFTRTLFAHSMMFVCLKK